MKPDANNITVLSKGNSNGLTDSTPLGGHWAPISTEGDRALWKNVQNMAKKKSASLTINKAIPMFKPLCTADVWLPKYVASQVTSLNQKHMDAISKIRAKKKKSCEDPTPCIVETPDVVRVSKEADVKIGQGDGDTRWNGCA